MSNILSVRSYTNKRFSFTFTILDTDTNEKISFPLRNLESVSQTLDAKSAHFGKTVKVREIYTKAERDDREILLRVNTKKREVVAELGKLNILITAKNHTEAIEKTVLYQLDEKEWEIFTLYVRFAVISGVQEKLLTEYEQSGKSGVDERNFF